MASKRSFIPKTQLGLLDTSTLLCRHSRICCGIRILINSVYTSVLESPSCQFFFWIQDFSCKNILPPTSSTGLRKQWSYDFALICSCLVHTAVSAGSATRRPSASPPWCRTRPPARRLDFVLHVVSPRRRRHTRAGTHSIAVVADLKWCSCCCCCVLIWTWCCWVLVWNIQKSASPNLEKSRSSHENENHKPLAG